MLQQLVFFLVILATANAQATEWAVKHVIESNFTFDETIVEDIFYVAEHSGADPMILASIINRESNGKRDAIRYCTEWKGGISKGRHAKCLKERSCYTGCRGKKEVWNNRLDVGLWQLRGAPTWSWVRWYRKNHDPDTPRDCAMDRECSREVMIMTVLYLKGRAAGKNPRKCTRPKFIPQYQWIAYWNWCGSYNKHVRAARKLWEQADALIAQSL